MSNKHTHAPATTPIPAPPVEEPKTPAPVGDAASDEAAKKAAEEAAECERRRKLNAGEI